LLTQRPGQVEGQVDVSIALGRPADNRKRDLDNVATKALLDLVTSHNVITDDSMVTSLTCRWDTSVPAGRAIIIIRPAMADVVAYSWRLCDGDGLSQGIRASTPCPLLA